MIAPDLAADGSSSSYEIDISKWAAFNKSKRHLCLCLVTLHQAVRGHGPVSHNQTLFHYHQACAAEILNHKIETLGLTGPDPELFEDISLFFFSQIQASAYGAWRAHLNAAKTLFNLWGMEALVGNPDYSFHLCHLVLADVFGTTMAPASQISTKDVAQHKVYLSIIDRFNVDVCSTMVPIPEVIARAIASTNIERATAPHQDVLSTEQEQESRSLSSSVLETLQNFDPSSWALHLPGHTSNQATSWALLATCFQTAAFLYYVQSCAPPVSVSSQDTFKNVRTSTYSSLCKATCKLFSLKQQKGIHYKFVLWPMVINGLESIIRQDEHQLRFLCKSLEQTTIDLGTLSMRDAATFLNELWSTSTNKEAELSGKIDINWDGLFHCAPLFLL